MNSAQTCIILAGGFGTRLRSIVSNVPKPLAPVGGTPFLGLLLSHCYDKGIKNIVLSLHYQSDQIIAFSRKFADRFQFRYIVEDTPLGTGGGIKRCLMDIQDEHVFVVNGDTFFDVDYLHLFMVHLKAGSVASLALAKIEGTDRYGTVDLDPRTGMVTSFFEKSSSHLGEGLINGGVYLLNRQKTLDLMPPENVFSFEKEFLQRHFKTQRFLGVPYPNANFIDIGIPSDYERAQTLLSGKFTLL
ncbi:MAG: nucleotidyltransferase family protein [Oligoflexales bacterium]